MRTTNFRAATGALLALALDGFTIIVAGDTAIVTTEFNMVWLIDRARLYASELPLPRRRSSAP